MSNLSQSRRASCAVLALLATFAVQSLWLGGLDRDAAITIAAIDRA